jgi:hypothetical protein
LEQVAANQLITLDRAAATPGPDREATRADPLFAPLPVELDYTHRPSQNPTFDIQPLAPRDFNDQGPPLLASDLDEDGRSELIVGGGVDQASRLIWLAADGSPERSLPLPAPFTEGSLVTDLAVIDYNGDGLPDLYEARGGTAAGGNHMADRIFLQTAPGVFTGQARIIGQGAFNTSCVAVTQTAGGPWLFLGGGGIAGRYPESADNRLLHLSADGELTDQSGPLAAVLPAAGRVTDADWHDLDGDGREELIVVGEWMAIYILGWQEGQLIDRTDRFLSGAAPGWWKQVAIADLNADGRPDLIVGNQGYNTPQRVTAAHPAFLIADDINGDGAVDPVLFLGSEEGQFPDPGRDELLSQLTELRRTYTDYRSYAAANQEEILALLGRPGELLRVTEQASQVYIQQTDGSYRAVPLPPGAQYAPVHAILAGDLTGDGATELLLAGNETGGHLRVGLQAANQGQLYRWRDGRLIFVPQSEAGFSLRGQVRGLAAVGDRVYVSTNGGKLSSYVRVTGRQ